MYKNLKHHWSIQELVTIGVFAAAAKVITMVVALAGGGMNPVRNEPCYSAYKKPYIYYFFHSYALQGKKKWNDYAFYICIINSITAFNGGRGFHLFRDVYGVIYW